MLRVRGVEQTQANLKRLAEQSPARARRAVNRTIGVARQRVITSIASATGLSRAVIGGRRGGTTRAGVKRKGRGYVKGVRATRRRAQGALVVLTRGVRFGQTRRKTLGGLRRAPGGLGQPFSATMPSGHSSVFERRAPQSRTSRRATDKTQRRNLPIREVVIPIEPYASRAARVVMRRVSRTVYPAKVWEELQKSIKPAR